MPKTKISEYSTTNSANTDIESINIDEGCAPSGINNAIRELMVHLKEFQTGSSGDPLTVAGGMFISGGGSANTLTVTGILTASGGTILSSTNTLSGSNIISGNINSSGTNTFSGSNVMSFGAGTSASPSIYFASDTNTGIFSPAADQVAVATNGVERVNLGNSATVFNETGADVDFRVEGDTVTNLLFVDASRDAIGVGVNPYPWAQRALQVGVDGSLSSRANVVDVGMNIYFDGSNYKYGRDFFASDYRQVDGTHAWLIAASGTAGNNITFTQAMTLDTNGNLLVGNTATNATANMLYWNRGGGVSGHLVIAHTEDTNATAVLYLNREGSDGTLVEFRQANTAEGSISVSGTTVTYGGGHLARFGQLPDGSEDLTLLKGTVLTNLDEMCVWINKETGVPADNEQCNKVKISDVDGDANVAGVFVSWSYDEQHDTNDLFIAMTGDMIIRIAQGVVVQKGDLLMSAGDGTAKPQDDDIVRSKTVAKVTSNHVTCIYADGSYCVPCVLMAC